MRICLASIHPTSLSGQLVTLAGLCKRLEQRDHHVTAVTVVRGSTPFASLVNEPAGGRQSIAKKLIRMFSVLRRVVAHSKDVELVHMNLPTPAFALLGDILQLIVPVPVIVGFEAQLADIPRLFRSSDILRAPRFYVLRAVVNNGLFARCTWHGAAHYVVSSGIQARELRHLGFPTARISVIGNVIDSDRVQCRDKEAARRFLGLPNGPLVAYIGHYHHVKGTDYLIDAFRRVAMYDRRCSLVLAWSGNGDPNLVENPIRRAELDQRVIRLGKIPLGTLLSAIDVLVLPYRYTMGQNALPMLLLEAMAAGVPLVTSDLPLLREVARHGETAILTSPGDVQSLAQGIVQLLSDDLLRENMVVAQHRLMENDLEPSFLATKYEQLYERVLKRKTIVLRPEER